MSGTADAGRLLVKIEATSAQLRQELERAKQQVAGFASQAQQQVSRLGDAWKGADTAAARANASISASTTATLDRLKGAASQAGSIMSQFSGAMAQGQTAVGALASSLPTLVAALGIGGAAAAAATAVAFLGSKFLETREAQVTLADAVKSSGEVYQSLIQASERYRAGTVAEREELVRLTQSFRALNDEQVQFETRRFQAEQQRIEAGRQNTQQAIEQERVLRRVQDAVAAYAESARQASASGSSLPPMAEFAPQVAAAWEAMARFRAEMSNAEGPSRDVAAAVVTLSNGLAAAQAAGGRFSSDLGALVSRLTAMVPELQAGDDRARNVANALALLAERATGSQVALTGVGAAASRTAAQLQALRDVANRNPTASVDQIRARVEAEIEALRRGGLEAQQRQAQQFREEDRVNQLREQAIRDRRTQLQALGATAEEIDQDIAQNSIAILQAAMGAANLEGQRDRLVSTAREAAREAGREGGRTAREAWIDAFDAPRLMAGTNILLLSEGDRRQAEEIRRLFAESRREAERASEQSQRAAERELDRANQQLDRTSERFGGQISEAMVDGLSEGSQKGEPLLQRLGNSFKRIVATALAEALNVTLISPAFKSIISATGLVGPTQAQITAAGGAAATATGSNVGNTMGSVAAGRTLLGSWPSFSDGGVTGGVGGVFQPGYQFSTGFDTINSAANASAVGGISYGQLGMGALGIAGGAYGVYSGLQMGGAKGYTQAAGGAVGIAGGAAGLAVAGGMTTGAGALAGGALGTAVAATAAWAPYIAAALAIAAMFMKGGSPTNAAAGANINMTAGQVNLENSGKQTSETASARDEMAKLVTATIDRVSTVLGVRPSGYMGFELGQRDSSRVVYNGNLVGTAAVGDQQGLANIIGRAIMMGFRDAPGISDVERRILSAAGDNVDTAVGLLQQTKAIKDTYGSDALSPTRTYPTQALWSMAEQTGNIDTMVGALKAAAELTAAYGDILGPINEVSQKAADIAWGTGSVDTLIQAFQGAAELTKAYGDALDPNKNATFRALFNASAATGDVTKFLAAMQGAAELTKAYGDALNDAQATHVVGMGGTDIQKIVSDLQWLFQVYKPLAGAAEQVSALQQAIEASNRTYNDAIARAHELGLAEQKLVENREKAAETIRQQVRDSYDDMMRQAQGLGSVAQAVADVKAAFQNFTANGADYRAVGRDPAALYNAQLGAITKDMDFESLRAAAEQLKGLDQVAATFFEAAAAAAEATLKANEAAARAQTAASYDAALREATGKGWVNQIISLAETVASNADAFRAAGRDPGELLAAQIKGVIDGLDPATLATAAANLQGLDSVTSDFVRAAIATAQATAAMADAAAQAAQRVADAADYDAKMRSAMGLDLVNTIVSIRQQIDAMADRYSAAGRDPAALYTAQVNASLQGKSVDELAKTAAALQGIDTSAAALATTALEQAIAADAQAAAAEIAAQAQRDAEQAQQDAARAAEAAARGQEQAAQEAQRAAQQLAQAGQNIKDYVAKLKSGTSAGFSPTDRLAAAQSQYNADLALAQGGNLDALGRVTSDADALIEAAKAMYASGTQFQQIRDTIIAQLTALPAVQSADQQIISGLDRINSSIGVSNSSLSSTTTKLDTANARLASIDANNDGVVTIEEIQAAAKARITEAQAELTAAATSNDTKTGLVRDAVLEGNTTGYSDNNLLLGIYQNTSGLRLQISDVRLDLAAINTLIDSVRKYTGAAAINTMYGRPVAQEPGIGAISAKGNLFGDGSLITAPTAVPLSIMGEGGRPEAVIPLERDSRGRLGARLLGGGGNGAGNDNRPVVAAIERGWQQSAVETMALRDEMRAMRAEITSLRNAQQRRNAS